MMDFVALAQQCAPDVAPQTMAAVVNVESDYNPFAIGVVDGHLERQPKTKAEAIATAKALEAADWNFSLGVGQVNRYNLASYGLTYETAFQPCDNIRAASAILKDCYVRASGTMPDEQDALRAAFSCYYSGNFIRGFKPDAPGQLSYVQKIVANADQAARAIPVVPNIKRRESDAPASERRAAKPTKPQPSPDNGPVVLHTIPQGGATTPEKPAPEKEQSEKASESKSDSAVVF